MNERRGNPPFQFRLDPELRKAMEEAQRQDGDESWTIRWLFYRQVPIRHTSVFYYFWWMLVNI